MCGDGVVKKWARSYWSGREVRLKVVLWEVNGVREQGTLTVAGAWMLDAALLRRQSLH